MRSTSVFQCLVVALLTGCRCLLFARLCVVATQVRPGECTPSVGLSTVTSLFARTSPPPSPLVHVLVSQSSKAYTVPTVLFTSFVVLLPILTLNLLVGTNRLSRG